MSNEPKLTIGSTIWRFDANRRVYPPAPEGKLWAPGGPIYREHWVAVRITGETTRSWVTPYGKVAKKGRHPGYAFSEQEVEDDCWLNAHRYSLSGAVQKYRDAQTLRQIAALLNFTPAPPQVPEGGQEGQG